MENRSKKNELKLKDVANFVADYRNAVKTIEAYGSKMGEIIGDLNLEDTELSLDLIVEFLALEKHRSIIVKHNVSQLKVLSRLLDTALAENDEDPDLIEMR